MSASYAALHIISDRWKRAQSVILFVLFAEQRAPRAALLKTRELWLGFSQREGLVKPFRSDLNNREASQSAGQVYSSLTQQQGAALLIDAMTVLQRFGIHEVYWPKGKLYPLTEGFWS